MHPPKFTRETRELFLRQLRLEANVSIAARAAGISRRAAYNWRRDDPDFASEWDEAIEQALDAVEHELLQRAVEGVDHPVTHEGKITDWYRKKSDSLLLSYVKAYRRRFAERIEHVGAGGEPLQLTDAAAQAKLLTILEAGRRRVAIAQGATYEGELVPDDGSDLV